MRWVPLTRFALLSAALITTLLVGVNAFYSYVVIPPYTRDNLLKSMDFLGDPQPATVYTEMSDDSARTEQEPASLAEIMDRGVLRICYAPNDYPSSFFNRADPPRLVGFDIEMAHRFARRIQLPIELLPVGSAVQAAESLDAGSCDILMSSLPITLDSSQRFAMTSPVFDTALGVIVRDHHRDSFRTWNGARQQGAALRVATGAGPVAMPMARSLLPDATFVPVSRIEDVKTMFESGATDVDAILHSSEHGAAWTLLYPEFTVVVPTPSSFLPFGYAVARGNDELLTPLNAWLGEQEANGTIAALYRHWMLGQAVNN